MPHVASCTRTLAPLRYDIRPFLPSCINASCHCPSVLWRPRYQRHLNKPPTRFPRQHCLLPNRRFSTRRKPAGRSIATSITHEAVAANGSYAASPGVEDTLGKA